MTQFLLFQLVISRVGDDPSVYTSIDGAKSVGNPEDLNRIWIAGKIDQTPQTKGSFVIKQVIEAMVFTSAVSVRAQPTSYRRTRL